MIIMCGLSLSSRKALLTLMVIPLTACQWIAGLNSLDRPALDAEPEGEDFEIVLDSPNDTEQPCTPFEAVCHDGADNDCDGHADCDDEDCTHPCACAQEGEPICETGETCCNSGCCNTYQDLSCCGGCSQSCPPGQDFCCDGTCASCCLNTHCDDENECTDNVCTGGACTFPSRPGYPPCSSAEGYCCGDECLTCCIDEHCNDANPCTADACTGGSCTHAGIEDMLPCEGGVCCGGECRAGGSCCSDSDCSTCRGTAESCASLSSQADCSAQIDCSWSGTNTCGPPGTAVACSTFSGLQCIECGCTDNPPCVGSIPCNSITTEERCGTCHCTWDAMGCTGAASACESLAETPCSQQAGCYWSLCNTDTYQCT